MESAVPFGGTNLMIIIFPYSTITPTTFTGKVFISTPEDTGPAHTQMKLQHRSRAPGPPYNSCTRSVGFTSWFTPRNLVFCRWTTSHLRT